MKNLVLLHGALGDARELDAVKQQLWAHYEVWVLSFSGHGGRTPDEPFSVNLFVRDLYFFIERNHLERVYLFGYSLGGFIGVEFARRYPNLVERVFTFATKWNWTPEVARHEAKMLDPEKIKEKVPTFAQLLEKRHEEDWEKLVLYTADFLVELGNNPTPENHWKKVTTPVCVAVGDQDKLVSVEESEQISRELQNGRLIVLRGTPHAFEKAPHDELARLTVSFFQEDLP